MSYDGIQENLNDRLRSISTNAVQEGRVAKGRGALPFLDKDSRIQHMIERLLHELTEIENVKMDAEHYPLVERTQPQAGENLDQISNILENLSSEIMKKTLGTAVKAQPPKSK